MFQESSPKFKQPIHPVINNCLPSVIFKILLKMMDITIYCQTIRWLVDLICVRRKLKSIQLALLIVSMSSDHWDWIYDMIDYIIPCWIYGAASSYYIYISRSTDSISDLNRIWLMNFSALQFSSVVLFQRFDESIQLSSRNASNWPFRCL